MRHCISTASGLVTCVAALLLFTLPLRAEPPRVAVDIAPVHSLAARVMAGVGAPALILPPGASPHGHAMRPSEAAALDAAEVIFWIGPDLTPWFAPAIESLGAGARVVTLAELPGLTRLDFRTGARFAAHDHDGEAHAQGGAHAHDDHKHAEDGHDDHEHAEDAHDEDGHGHDDHAHAGTDPHLWLDPLNAVVMLQAMAEALAAADPANAATYRANAEEAAEELRRQSERIRASLAAVRGRPFIVFHDGYHYFEARFGIEAAGAIAVSDASEPGAARVAEIRATIEESGARCVFTEPQFMPRLAEMLAAPAGARIGVLDPMGTSLAAPGPQLYPALLDGMAEALHACLSGD